MNALTLTVLSLTIGGAGAPAVVPFDTVPGPAEVVRLLSDADTRDAGRVALVSMAPTLDADRATLWLQLLATVDRTGSAATAAAARAVLSADGGDPLGGAGALERVLEGAETPEADRPALLSLAAHLADRVDGTRAAVLRKRLEDEWPDAVEAPEARLLRARFLLSEPATVPAGIELLEDMLVRSPGHPLAPEARRLRQQASRGGGPGR